jgi:hypothetical protein
MSSFGSDKCREKTPALLRLGRQRVLCEPDMLHHEDSQSDLEFPPACRKQAARRAVDRTLPPVSPEW